MLTPVVGTIEAMGEADLPVRALADRIADFFVREVYETRRRDVIRLMIAEGPRFPQLAEFYYREVLSRIIAAMRALLARAAARGEVPAEPGRFPANHRRARPDRHRLVGPVRALRAARRARHDENPSSICCFRAERAP